MWAARRLVSIEDEEGEEDDKEDGPGKFIKAVEEEGGKEEGEGEGVGEAIAFCGCGWLIVDGSHGSHL